MIMTVVLLATDDMTGDIIGKYIKDGKLTGWRFNL